MPFEFIKRVSLVWDNDFTKLTPLEKERLLEADKEIAEGKLTDHDAIDWD